MHRLTDGVVEIPKLGYKLRLDFSPWLDKVPHDNYVLVHSQDRPVDQRYWGVLCVDGSTVTYHEAMKIESYQPHNGWHLSEDANGVVPMAFVYPGCRCSVEANRTATITAVESDKLIDSIDESIT